MTSQQLGVFRAVGKYLNFSKAAETLYVSQSYVSKQIAALEKEWNVQLFQRDHHSVSFTPAGQYLYDFFTEYQTRLMEAVLHAQGMEREESAPLSLGILSTLESRHIPEIIRAFRQTHADAAVAISFHDEEALMNGLWQGRFDMVITNLGAVSNPDAFSVLPLLSSTYYLCVSRSLLPECVSPQDAFDQIRHLPYIALAGSEISDRRLSDRVRQRFHISLTGRITAPNPESLYRMVESEMGYSFVTAIPDSSPPEPRITFADTGIPYSCVVLYREDGNPKPHMDAFLQSLESVYRLD